MQDVPDRLASFRWVCCTIKPTSPTRPNRTACIDVLTQQGSMYMYYIHLIFSTDFRYSGCQTLPDSSAPAPHHCFTLKVLLTEKCLPTVAEPAILIKGGRTNKITF
jgi:hypothetical protein